MLRIARSTVSAPLYTATIVDTFAIALFSLGGGSATDGATAIRAGTLPRGEIASDHFLERVDFGAHQLVQARVDRRIERRKLRAATEKQLPRSCLLEKIGGAVGLLVLEPVHEMTRLAGDAREP